MREQGPEKNYDTTHQTHTDHESFYVEDGEERDISKKALQPYTQAISSLEKEIIQKNNIDVGGIWPLASTHVIDSSGTSVRCGWDGDMLLIYAGERAGNIVFSDEETGLLEAGETVVISHKALRRVFTCTLVDDILHIDVTAEMTDAAKMAQKVKEMKARLEKEKIGPIGEHIIEEVQPPLLVDEMKGLDTTMYSATWTVPSNWKLDDAYFRKYLGLMQAGKMKGVIKIIQQDEGRAHIDETIHLNIHGLRLGEERKIPFQRWEGRHRKTTKKVYDYIMVTYTLDAKSRLQVHIEPSDALRAYYAKPKKTSKKTPTKNTPPVSPTPDIRKTPGSPEVYVGGLVDFDTPLDLSIRGQKITGIAETIQPVAGVVDKKVFLNAPNKIITSSSGVHDFELSLNPEGVDYLSDYKNLNKVVITADDLKTKPYIQIEGIHDAPLYLKWRVVGDILQLYWDAPNTLSIAGDMSSLRQRPEFAITSEFGKRINSKTGEEEMHKGIDINLNIGRPVGAMAAGTVVFSGNKGDGYGNKVVIDHGGGVHSLYAHLGSENLAPVGTVVQAGQKIGEIGNTGRVRSKTGHLHFEVRKDGVPLDPRPYIDGVSHETTTFSEIAETITQVGIASFYNTSDNKQNLTANGEQFDKDALTAAHRTLPFNTIVKVTRKDDPLRTIEVRINDRGPYVDGRIIDVTEAGAKKLGLCNDKGESTEGITEVIVEVMDK